MKILANTRRASRTGLMLGLVGATVGIGLLAAAPANAAVGNDPGQLTIAPATGTLDTNPTWTANDNCNAPNNDTAFLAAYDLNGNLVVGLSANILGAPVAPFGGTLEGTWNDFINAGLMSTGTTYELDVLCGTAQVPQQFTYVTFGTDGTYTVSDTPPASNATPTTTTLAADPTSAAPGDAVSLTATVDPSGAAGNVQFVDGATVLGSAAVDSGNAALTVSSLPCGDNSIVANFQPTDPTAFGPSSSSAVDVTISGAACALQGSETVNVAIPATGSFTFTVSPTPVDLGTATANGDNLEATGQLSPVTVSDTRNSAPGWSVAGQVSDFSDGNSATIDGDSLGWTPAVTTQDTASDVTAGAAITAGSNPGLKEGSTLGSAGANQGVGNSTLGGGLDLVVPASQNAGSYSATLTITAIDTAS